MTELILVKVMPSVLVAAMLSPVLDSPSSVYAPLLDVHNWVATTEWADWSMNDMDDTDVNQIGQWQLGAIIGNDNVDTDIGNDNVDTDNGKIGVQN